MDGKVEQNVGVGGLGHLQWVIKIIASYKMITSESKARNATIIPLNISLKERGKRGDIAVW